MYYGASMEITTHIGCSVNCKYCPQDILLKQYFKGNSTNVTDMTLETFKICIDKLPKDIRIVFSGMCEPWQNPNCVDMILYADEEGYDVSVFTTLKGMSKFDFDRIKHIDFKQFQIHIPDQDENFKIAITEEYKELLIYIVNYMSNKEGCKRSFSCQGEVIEGLNPIIEGGFFELHREIFDRAGHLNNEEIEHNKHHGRVFCRSSKRNLNQNVLLPNGDVILCCMDYGLEYKLGNLLELNYANLFSGNVFKKLTKQLDDENCNMLCKNCHQAVAVDTSKTIYDYMSDIVDLKQELSNYEGWVEQLLESERILSFDMESIEKKAEIQEMKIMRQEDKISQQEDKISQQEDKISQQEDLLNDNERQIKTLNQETINKQGWVEQLLEVEREYERFKKSRSWRYMSYIWKINQVIVPHGSKRRLGIKIIIKFVKHPMKFINKVNLARLKKAVYYFKREGVSGVSRRLDECIVGTTIKAKEIEISKIKKQRDLEEYNKINISIIENPKVSIIIPVYNQFEYTYNCIKSIKENTKNVDYEIIVADDCSTDLTININKIISGIKVVKNKENLRFLRNCNNAAQYAIGKYILFLNNDTQVQENWLSPLVTLIESNNNIGMVGSKLVYPDGRLQEAGGIFWKEGSAWNYGNGQNHNESEFNYVKEVDYISGASIMLSKELWEKIGGFDERFAPAYCEDSDLAFEVRKRGYKVMYQPLSVVVHFEGVSNGTDVTQGQKSYQIKNSHKLYDKWKNEFEKHENNGQMVFSARDCSGKKKTLVMIDHYVPQFDKDAGSRTVFEYLKLFVKEGFNVKFIGDNFYKHEPYTTILQQLGIEVLYGEYYSKNWKVWMTDNVEHIDFVFLNRPHISIKYIDFIKEKLNAKIIYYGHDLHYLREQREFKITGNKMLLKSIDGWKEKEFYLMNKADIVYYPSIIEVNQILKENSKIKAKAIPAYLFERLGLDEYECSEREDIMFIGGFGHHPNVDGVKWFAEKVFPNVIEKLPQLKFFVLGSNPPDEIKRLESKNIIVKGFVSDEELEKFYRKVRVVVVPLRYGAGIKGKVVEAMRFGVPVVTTSIGAEGIVGAQNIMIIADGTRNFAKEVINLYDDEKTLKQLSQKGIDYINNNFMPKNAIEVIAEDFEMRGII